MVTHGIHRLVNVPIHEAARLPEEKEKAKRERAAVHDALPAVPALPLSTSRSSCWPPNEYATRANDAAGSDTLDDFRCSEYAHGTFATAQHSTAYKWTGTELVSTNNFACSHTMATSSLDAAQKELIAYIQKRSADLPPNIQQRRVHNASRREGKRVIKDLEEAAKVLGEARVAYEEALLARSQHISTWKMFLKEAVKSWTEYGKLFEQHEAALQERISAAKADFQDAKECLDASKKSAGNILQEIMQRRGGSSGRHCGLRHADHGQHPVLIDIPAATLQGDGAGRAHLKASENARGGSTSKPPFT